MSKSSPNHFNKKNVLLIFRKEVNDILRDRRTLFIMTLLPLLMYPVMLPGMVMLQSHVNKVASETTYKVFIRTDNPDGELFALISAEYDKEFKMEGEGEKPAKAVGGVEVSAPKKGGLIRKFSVEQGPAFPADLKKRILARELHAAVDIPKTFEEDMASKDAEKIKKAKVEILYDASNDRSQTVRKYLNTVLEEYREKVFLEALKASSIPKEYMDPAMKYTDVAAAQGVISGDKGNALAKIIAVMVVLMSLTSALYPAIDLSAGEKERGTMETLLISPASRLDIVLGKFFTVLSVALVAAFLNVASMGVSVFWFMKNIIDVNLPPLLLLYMALILIPLMALFSALSLAVSTFAKSFKEGQNYLNPLMIAALLPSMMAMLPGFELNNVVCFVPVMGTTMLFREIFLGSFNYGQLILVAGSSTIYALLSIQWTVSLFNREDVLFRESEEINWKFWIREGKKRPLPNGLEALFVFAAAMGFFHLFGSKGTIQANVMAQIFGLAAVSLVVAKLVNVKWRETFSLRAFSWHAVPAVLLIGLSAPVLARILFLSQISEPSFRLTEDHPLVAFMSEGNIWMVLAFIALMPAVCEEILCRGFLFAGFRQSLGVLRGIFLSAILFGFMHMDPSRLLFTTTMGLVLGFIVWRTGSIFLCSLVHLMNNGISAGLGLYFDRFAKALPDRAKWPDWMRWMEWIPNTELGLPADVWIWTLGALTAFCVGFLLLGFSKAPVIEDRKF